MCGCYESSNAMDVINFVIDIVVAVATVAAVIVALVANYKSSKAIKMSLKIHEQSKNLDLYDKRLALYEDVKNNKNVSDIAVNLLFDKKIIRCYEKMVLYRKKQREFYFDKIHSEDFAKEIVREEKLEDFRSNILEFKSKMSNPECPDSVFDEYRTYCDKFEVEHSFSGKDEDLKVYNYYKCEEQEDKYKELADEKQKELLELIAKFIKESISPIDAWGELNEIQF